MDVTEESIKLMAFLHKYYLNHTKTDLKRCCFILSLSMKMFIGFVKLHTDMFITLHHNFKIERSFNFHLRYFKKQNKNDFI